MKRISIYAISFLSLTLLLTTCYYLSYRYALNKFNDNATEQSGDMKNLTLNRSEDAAAKTKTTVSMDADYLVQTYDMATEELKEEKQNIPNELIGLNREQIIAKLNAYVQDKPLDEYNAGLVSYQLVSFSPDKVVVKKTYNSEGILYKYYMVIMNNSIVVYYSDKQTVFEYTGISADELAEEDRAGLLYGVWVKDEDELYSILENYTS